MAARNLRRDITVVLSLKFAIVLLAAFFVFGPKQRPVIDGDSVGRQILDNADQQEPVR